MSKNIRSNRVMTVDLPEEVSEFLLWVVEGLDNKRDYYDPHVGHWVTDRDWPRQKTRALKFLRKVYRQWPPR